MNIWSTKTILKKYERHLKKAECPVCGEFDVGAQSNLLPTMLDYGVGVACDHAQAFQWLLKSAAQKLSSLPAAPGRRNVYHAMTQVSGHSTLKKFQIDVTRQKVEPGALDTPKNFVYGKVKNGAEPLCFGDRPVFSGCSGFESPMVHQICH